MKDTSQTHKKIMPPETAAHVKIIADNIRKIAHEANQEMEQMCKELDAIKRKLIIELAEDYKKEL